MSNGTCGAETKAGDPCESFPYCDDCGRCYTHCGHVAEEREQARARGGVATAQKRKGEDPAVPLGEAPQPPENLEDAAAWAAWAAHLCATGRLGNTRARSIAKLLDTFRRCVERGEARRQLEDTIERLEAAVERAEGPGLEALP